SSAPARSRVASSTARPARAIVLASAVPHAPPPTTAICSKAILHASPEREGGATFAAAGLGGGGEPRTSPNGHLACGLLSRVSVRPSARRSAPAHAIIAPLSVHNCGGGTTSTVPASKATRCKTLRIASLAATPPAATSAVGLP